MTTGLPKPPTISGILIGIGLFVLVLLAFLRLADVVKFAGAALMFVPAKLGLIDMVLPDDVIPFSLAENPSSIKFSTQGQYLVYLNNYDLLVVHDAIVAGNTRSWIKIKPENVNTEIKITLIGRGLAWYDTPFAAGRPVATFKIDQPGTYQIVHPAYPDIANVVPDTITGKESRITFWVLAEIGLIGGSVYYGIRKRNVTKRRQRARLLAQNRARVDDTWKRIEKRAEEKRKNEDQPHWKRR